jgi:hypothetical protein
MSSKTCSYCGTDSLSGSCTNCGAPLKETTVPASNDTVTTQTIDDFLAFVGEYAPLRTGVLYNFFVWPLVVMVVSLIYFIRLLVQPKDWTNDRWRVYTLLFLFAPIGLWGVYMSKTIPYSEKIGVLIFTVCLVIVYSIFGK